MTTLYRDVAIGNKVIRAPGGGLAKDLDCCCERPSTSCCQTDTMPWEMTITLAGFAGVLASLNGSYDLEYTDDPAYLPYVYFGEEDDPINHIWLTPCIAYGGVDLWYLEAYVRLGDDYPTCSIWFSYSLGANDPFDCMEIVNKSMIYSNITGTCPVPTTTYTSATMIVDSVT